MELSFTRESRLLAAAEYSHVFSNGCCKAGDNAFLILAAYNGLERGRLGLVIAKKQLKLAVARNRVKRISRELFRHKQQQLIGVDLVVLCRPGVKGLEKAEIRRKLDRLFDKIVGLHNR